jgi:hypothetical protein
MDLEDLLAPVAGSFVIEDALSSWRWLVPEAVRPLVVTALGDLFVIRGTGEVAFLDTIAGTYGEAAASVADWEQALTDPEFLDRHFSPGFVMQMRDAGVILAQGECYTPRRTPTLGGEWTVDNFLPAPWYFHFDRQGRVHEAIKDLPDGTVITKWNYTEL